MIEREGREIYLQCDGCSAYTESDEFETVIAQAKREGWRISKAGSDWEHHCPDCKERQDVEDFE